MRNTPENAPVNVGMGDPVLGHAEHRVKFDPTISLGHVLTFVSLILAGFGVYNGMDKRVTVLEEQRRVTEERVSERERFWKESVLEIKTDVKEVQRSLNDFSRALSTRKIAP